MSFLKLQSRFVDLRSLLSGMGITFANGFKPSVTELYPHTKPKMSKAYRSCIEFIRFPATNSHDCIACDKCAKACPSDCISIEGGKPEGLKRKRPMKFEVDFALCSLCGLCIDACPTNTLKYSRGCDETSFDRRTLVHDMLAGFREVEPAYIQQQIEEAEVKAKEAAAKKAAAAAAAASAKPEAGIVEGPAATA